LNNTDKGHIVYVLINEYTYNSKIIEKTKYNCLISFGESKEFLIVLGCAKGYENLEFI